MANLSTELIPEIRVAHIEDAEGIHELFSPFVEKGIVLARSVAEIREIITDFIVMRVKDEVIGCVSLYNYGNQLREVRSLIVRKDYQGHHYGSALLQKVIEVARELKTSRLFALTLREHFFCVNGFHIVEKELFPEKVWKDCWQCPKRECCDEVAVLMNLE